MSGLLQPFHLFINSVTKVSRAVASVGTILGIRLPMMSKRDPARQENQGIKGFWRELAEPYNFNDLEKLPLKFLIFSRRERPWMPPLRPGFGPQSIWVWSGNNFRFWVEVPVLRSPRGSPFAPSSQPFRRLCRIPESRRWARAVSTSDLGWRAATCQGRLGRLEHGAEVQANGFGLGEICQTSFRKPR
ncbi:hypothetical protein EV129_106185 [Rhizobium azibense]|uniref:Uncharacterized protein n=1 Tax=Rhizobium azibense TaxID=1136135 RepID=A0A4R3RMZ4_9HYPH|nr:hypothetical protein EV129_106185 [Rhizobium azibense]